LVEHVAYPQRVVEEMFRVLRPGGVMVVVMPFVWPLHGYPDDYVRLTPRWFERICRQVGFSDVATEVASSGGTYNVLHNAAKMAAVEAERPDAAALRELHELAVVLLAALVPLDHGFVGGLDLWFHSVRCFARKPGAYQPSGRERDPRRPFVERALDLLADPLTGAPLELEDGRLVGRDYGHAYEVRAGIPIFTEPRHVEQRRGPLAASRDQVDAWLRQRVPPDRRERLPGWLRRAGARALRR
jgi:SAM-dependent methyltransferase